VFRWIRMRGSCVPARAMLLLTALILMILPMSAFAIGPMETERENSLTVLVTANGQLAEGVQFDLYRVADASEFAEFTLCGDFAEYPVSLKAETAEQWRKLSAALAGYAAADALVPMKTDMTDPEGKVCFTGLKCGLYLVMGRPYTLDAKVYSPETTLVALPGRDESDQWIYEMTITPKQGEPDDAPMNLEVIKIWMDGNSPERPTEVIMQLLCNGMVAEEVKLNMDNSWRYEWTNLEGGKLWQVIERPVPEDYIVDIDCEGNKVIVTNTLDDDSPEETPSPDEDTPPDEKLPQTGLNWQPVWLLGAIGMAMFLSGWISVKRSKG